MFNIGDKISYKYAEGTTTYSCLRNTFKVIDICKDGTYMLSGANLIRNIKIEEVHRNYVIA